MLIYCRVWLDWPSRSYRLLPKWWREPARMSNWECPKYHVCRVLPWNRRYKTHLRSDYFLAKCTRMYT